MNGVRGVRIRGGIYSFHFHISFQDFIFQDFIQKNIKLKQFMRNIGCWKPLISIFFNGLWRYHFSGPLKENTDSLSRFNPPVDFIHLKTAAEVQYQVYSAQAEHNEVFFWRVLAELRCDFVTPQNGKWLPQNVVFFCLAGCAPFVLLIRGSWQLWNAEMSSGSAEI